MTTNLYDQNWRKTSTTAASGTLNLTTGFAYDHVGNLTTRLIRAPRSLTMAMITATVKHPRRKRTTLRSRGPRYGITTQPITSIELIVRMAFPRPRATTR